MKVCQGLSKCSAAFLHEKVFFENCAPARKKNVPEHLICGKNKGIK